MSPRTYIGPFGRILPLPDGKEPERLQFPISALDETRTNVNMATYQLPPPERLQFGSDISSGFTEPTRYNTISQSSRTHAPIQPFFVDQSRSVHHKPLPSVSQLLTSSTQSSPIAPTFMPTSNSNPVPAASTHSAPALGWSSEHVVRPSQFPHQPSHLPPQTTRHLSFPTAGSPAGETHQINPSTRRSPPSYDHHQGLSLSQYTSSFGSNQQTLLSPQSHQSAPPILSHHQPTGLSHASQVQPMLSLDTVQPRNPQFLNDATHLHGQTSGYPTVMNTLITPEQNVPASPNRVKQQPRVVAERDIPGEGPSWIYDDGTTCKKIIDGETVNAQWGVTKAGKPRKRLAIACTTCREKKIKCDPAEPKCVQCEKFGRDCKFTTA